MIHLADATATEAAGRAVGGKLRIGDVILLSGDLGAGKTSFARGVLAELGLQEEAPSPSFALVIPYDHLRVPIWHVDLYRLDDPGQIDELGLDDALIDGALIIEWPERLGARGYAGVLKIHIAVPEAGGRNLTAEVPPSWEDRWPFP
jgi:tRNA threonylcarbamoyladenosine biosynthesis protein TsaE